jgi:hypothetical protein
MRHVIFASLLLCAPIAAGAADALKISQIEQDIIRLQQQIQEQARQLETLRIRLVQSPALPDAREPSRAPPLQPGAWLDAAKWAQVKPGMSELEVITLLGAPTSMRANDGEHVLLYAMEIGASGFLGGSVTLRDRSVLQVQLPQLR